MSKYGVSSGPHFPLLGPNTAIYGVNLRIQPKYGKIRTKKNIFGHFSRSLIDAVLPFLILQSQY